MKWINMKKIMETLPISKIKLISRERERQRESERQVLFQAMESTLQERANKSSRVQSEIKHKTITDEQKREYV